MPGSSQACSQLQRNHLTLDGLPEVLRHVVTEVEVDRHTHQGLKLVFEAGDVEQGNFAEHCWRDGGEQIEITPFAIIASSGRAEDTMLILPLAARSEGTDDSTETQIRGISSWPMRP